MEASAERPSVQESVDEAVATRAQWEVVVGFRILALVIPFVPTGVLRCCHSSSMTSPFFAFLGHSICTHRVCDSFFCRSSRPPRPSACVTTHLRLYSSTLDAGIR